MKRLLIFGNAETLRRLRRALGGDARPDAPTESGSLPPETPTALGGQHVL